MKTHSSLTDDEARDVCFSHINRNEKTIQELYLPDKAGLLFSIYIVFSSHFIGSRYCLVVYIYTLLNLNLPLHN